jgi:hypothetical protein
MIALAALVAAFAVPASASAQVNCSQAHSDPTAAQYCPQGEVLGVSGGGGNVPVTETTPAPEAVEVEATESSAAGATLPFTGLDIGILLVAAAVLGGSGLLLRRLTGAGAPKG